MIRAIIAGSLVVFAAVSTLAQPASFISKKNDKALTLTNDLLWQEGNFRVVKSDKFAKQGRDLYLVRLPAHQKKINTQWLEKFGQVWQLRADRSAKNTHDHKNYALMKISQPQKLVELSAELHELGGACGGLQLLDGTPAIKKQKRLSAPVIPLNHNAQIQKLLSPVQETNIRKTMKSMLDWETRYHTHPQGQQTPQKLKELYEKLIPAGRSDVRVELFTHRRTPQPSVIVRILGQSKPDEILVMGSHLDAINRSENNEFTPGIDDNASGTATNHEIFRALMAQDIRPERTIEIHAYAAEEVGLVGSNEIARYYRDQQKNVLAMVQFDMNAYSADGKDRVWFVSNGTDRELTQKLGQIVDLYIKLPWDTASLWFGSSDHAAWERLGFPAAFPTENPRRFNHKLHTSKDTFEQSQNVSQTTAYARLGLAYLLHYAGFQVSQ